MLTSFPVDFQEVRKDPFASSSSVEVSSDVRLTSRPIVRGRGLEEDCAADLTMAVWQVSASDDYGTGW